jgi:hypothetical protein
MLSLQKPGMGLLAQLCPYVSLDSSCSHVVCDLVQWMYALLGSHEGEGDHNP